MPDVTFTAYDAEGEIVAQHEFDGHHGSPEGQGAYAPAGADARTDARADARADAQADVSREHEAALLRLADASGGGAYYAEVEGAAADEPVTVTIYAADGTVIAETDSGDPG
ncbi:hypothetical protein [Streptomyces sp. PT12]|uniref:hypothetical protein n=1 Tax=Streptomyces sp. PT12 TaxID=1510197 RepID=UPI000DE4F8E1|nr:hypothetical protein [Streptomyces sp. PT12]RBM24218.1 hypothetical protein DEH69_00520 [Streptomyces sp. PT12]